MTSTLPHASLRAALAVLALSVALLGCGTVSDAGGDKDAGGSGGKTGLTKKLPGPCQTDLESGSGKKHPKYTLYAWDTKGQLIEEKSGEGTTTFGGDVYTKKWAWDDQGRMTGEFFETTGSEPNYSWVYTYDGQGRRATRKGTQTGFGDVDCTFEYLQGKEDYNLLCSYKYTEEIKDDEGNVIDTKVYSGKYTIEYIYGIGQITELTTVDGSSSPEQLTRRFDKDGNLIAIELDPSLQGYPSHITSFEYKDGLRTHKKVDSDADGTPELTTTYTYDAHGNLTKSVVEVANVGVDRTLTNDFSCW